MRYGIDTDFLVAAELAEHPEHGATRVQLTRLIAAGDRFALAPQVLAEFFHIATDARRFERPLAMEAARSLAEQWWTAREVEPVFPNGAAMKQFFDWLRTRTSSVANAYWIRCSRYLSRSGGNLVADFERSGFHNFRLFSLLGIGGKYRRVEARRLRFLDVGSLTKAEKWVNREVAPSTRQV